MGYEIITVHCAKCGHTRHLPPECYTKPRRFVCRRCGTRTHEVRSVWVEGPPRANVVRLTRANVRCGHVSLQGGQNKKNTP